MSDRPRRRRFLLLALLVLLPGAARARPSFYGFTLPSWWKDSYAGAGAQKKPAYPRAGTGANSGRADPHLVYEDRGQLGRSRAPTGRRPTESLRLTIRNARSLGLRVVLKPHVNCEDGRATALIRPSDERLWFRTYREFILHYARLAAEEKVDLFVVGTEIFSMTGSDHRRDWEELIRDVRGVYAGKLTYAANWYDFMLVTFWGSLDYVGIDAYFPVVGGHNPKLRLWSWKIYLPIIASVSRAYGKTRALHRGRPLQSERRQPQALVLS